MVNERARYLEMIAELKNDIVQLEKDNTNMRNKVKSSRNWNFGSTLFSLNKKNQEVMSENKSFFSTKNFLKD